MSPARFTAPTATAVQAALHRVWATFGQSVRDARTSRRWTSAELARRAGVSRSLIYLIERGDAASFEACARVATALGLRLELDLVEPRARRFAGRAVDRPAGMGSRRSCAAPHREPDAIPPIFRLPAGSWNAKRAYLAPVIADRLGIRRWASVTHVMAGLWPAEVLHTLRLRTETCRALCPDPPDAFNGWWACSNPSPGESATFVVLDPFAAGKQRTFIGLDDALATRPRLRSYVDAVSRPASAWAISWQETLPLANLHHEREPHASEAVPAANHSRLGMCLTGSVETTPGRQLFTMAYEFAHGATRQVFDGDGVMVCGLRSANRSRYGE